MIAHFVSLYIFSLQGWREKRWGKLLIKWLRGLLDMMKGKENMDKSGFGDRKEKKSRSFAKSRKDGHMGRERGEGKQRGE